MSKKPELINTNMVAVNTSKSYSYNQWVKYLESIDYEIYEREMVRYSAMRPAFRDKKNYAIFLEYWQYQYKIGNI